jgi:type I restriction enzyme S subunit
MAGEWREVTLGEIAELVRGVSYRPADLLPDSSNGIPLLRATNIRDGGLDLGDVLFVPPELVQPNQMLRRYDVVIAMSSGSREAVGRLAQLRQDWIGCVGAFCAVIRADPRGVHPDFLGFVLQSPDFRTHVETHAVGTAIMNLSRERILGFSLKLPPLPEQRAIAHILGTLDDKIELNRRMSETLEAMARALFKAWFVDFEPVRAKMEGRWQRGQSLPGLPAHLYDLFPDRLVESELGEIPEGWRVVELEQVIEINPPRVLRRGQCAPYLDMASMPTRGHVPLRVVERPYTSGTRFTNGDTLLARITPCLENGKTAFVDFLAPNEVGWGSTEFIVLRPKPPLPAEFGYCLARDPDFREFAIQSMTGTSGRQRVQPEALARYLLVVPSDGVAKAFGALVEPWFRKASASERESRSLAALRDALLPKLIRGEIRVKEAERFVQDFGGERG